MNIAAVIDTPFAGLKVLSLKKWEDPRGTFLKILQSSALETYWPQFMVREIYFSISKRNVLRGMHFQVPPHDHDKIVFCQTGRILDVVVDLRKSSPTFKKTFSRELQATEPVMLLIPRGFAHGFLALEEDSTVLYVQNSEYHAAADSGIRWDSIGFSWPTAESIAVSQRDQSFDLMEEFHSPF